jgi:hypothetical protein
MSDVSHGPGWWVASDGKWYPPDPEALKIAKAEKVAQYRAFAESELTRANRAGRLDAQSVHANRATAAATIVLTYLLDAEWAG